MKRENLKEAESLINTIQELEKTLFFLTNTQGVAEVRNIRIYFNGVDSSGHSEGVYLSELLPKEVLITLAVHQLNRDIERLKKELESL